MVPAPAANWPPDGSTGAAWTKFSDAMVERSAEANRNSAREPPARRSTLHECSIFDNSACAPPKTMLHARTPRLAVRCYGPQRLTKVLIDTRVGLISISL